MKRLFWLSLFSFWTGSAAGALEPPRLVVVVVVDQFRPDYLTRSAAWFLPARQGDRLGGFRLLMEEGAAYWNASYSHLATFTCPGHAVVLTGADPAVSGIVSNKWYDRRAGRVVVCVDDGGGVGRSPRTLRVSGVGDELKLSNQGRSRVIGLGSKYYAAIALAGRMADLVLWTDDASGDWVSNEYYTGEDGLPRWVRQLNSERIPDGYAGKKWGKLLGEEAYAGADTTPYFGKRAAPEVGIPNPNGPYGLGWRFPHPLGNDAGVGLRVRFFASGLANHYVVETAKRAIVGERLGEDEAPDVLAVTLSANDKIGHYFGPNSPETLDVTLRTDRALADLFNFLKERLGEDRFTVVLTADHGVQETPEEVASRGGSAGRTPHNELVEAVEGALDARFGRADWVLAVTDPDLYLNRSAMIEMKLKPEDVEAAAAEAASASPGVYWAVPRSRIVEGRLPRTDWADRVFRNFHPERSGDVVLIFEPNWFLTETVVTTHGPHYAYNARVPILLWGKGVSAGSFLRPVDVKDIASTLSRLLGTVAPSGSSGQPLREALGAARP